MFEGNKKEGAPEAGGGIWILLLVLLHYSELCFLRYMQVNFRTNFSMR